MGGPARLADTFAAVMLVISAYCALRLAAAAARRRETELDADLLHLVMGVAMAGMLAPGLSFAPTSSWAGVFALAAAWFGWQEIRVWRGLGTGPWTCPYPVPHLAESLAMVYMLVAARTARGAGSGAGMAGMSSSASAAGTARLPELAVLFALFMVGYVAWLGDRFSAVGAVGAVGAVAASPASPAIVAAATSASTATARPVGTTAEAAPEAEPAAVVRTSMTAAAQAGGCWPVLAPRGACCYKIAMAIVMGYMLIVML
jgi:uncharacterized protein DUF5134